MKIQGRREYMARLESVAMTDIVLNMFIFFFISFSLLYTFNAKRVQKLDVKLPQAQSTTPIKSQNQLNITITSEGVVYLDEELVTKKELKEKTAELFRQNPNLSVVLRSDRLTRFKDIVTTLDILGEIGIKNLNIAAEAEDE